MKPPRLGVVSSRNLAALRARTGARHLTAAVLAELAAREGRDQLWIHPSAHGGLGLPPQPGPGARPGGPQPRLGFLRGADAWPADGIAPWYRVRAAGRELGLALPLLDPFDPWRSAPDGATMRDGVERFAMAVGLPWEWSAGSTAMRLLERVHRGPGAIRLESTMAPPEPATVAGTEADCRWFRSPTGEESQRRYLHAADVNGQYLGACSSVELGLGEAEQLDAPARVEPSSPGYWLVRFRPRHRGERPMLPHPATATGEPPGVGPLWLSTPTAALCAELGMVDSIPTAFVWPRHSRYLAGWYDRLRRAREQLLPCAATEPGAALALGSVKRVYTVGLGFLAGHWRGVGDPLYRPDWRHQVIGRARANLHRALRRLETPPLAVDVDTVYLASDERDPRAAFAGLRFAPGLGAWKLAGSAHLADVLEQLAGAAGRTGALRILHGAVNA